MKLILAILFALMLPLSGANVMLEWDDPDNPAGTVERYGVWIKAPGAAAFTQVGSAIGREFEVQDAGAGVWQVYVTAVSAEGVQGEPSNTISFSVPAAPANLRIRVAIESSSNLRDWQTVAFADVPAGGPQTFYRIAFHPLP